MAKEKTSVIDKAIAPKLDLSKTLKALDNREKDYYDKLEPEMKKKYGALVLMRYMSSAPDQRGIHEYFVTSVNDIVNENFWALSKHVELQHLLLCVCGLGSQQFHKWIPMVKKENDKIKKFLKKRYPNMNKDEYDIFIRNNSIDEFEMLCEEFGLEDKEIKDLVKNYEVSKSAK